MAHHSSASRRVVVTGIGAVSPLGLTAGATWSRALEGQGGVGLITQFDTTDCPVKIAAEVSTQFDPTAPVGPFYPRVSRDEENTLREAVSKKDLKKMGRFIHFTLTAGLEAYQDSGLDAVRDKIAPERIGTNIGVGMGGLPEIEKVHLDLVNKGYKRVTPFFVPQVITNMASGQLSILLNLRGPCMCNVTACASSAHSIGEAYRQIQRGDADVIFTGGAEATISPLGIGGFAAMRALSTRNDDPKTASRPFDVGRDGFVMGEGAAILILEELEHARRRGAKIYAELVGYGLSADAFHMTTPAPEGEGGFRAMEMAVRESGIDRTRVGYVNAHGTSTPAGDAEEASAIARLFPEGKRHLNVSSTKSMTGHMLGAAGAMEAVFSVLAVKDNRIPPTINLADLDPKCRDTGLDFTANRMVEKKVEYALSNSFGFGGTNASLLFGKLSG